MKKKLVVLGMALALFSCNNNPTAVEFKTAYVDTQKLMKEYEETKDIESKYKVKSEEMGKELEAEIAKFQKEAESFQADAQAKGMVWAQQKGAELQRKEQELSYKQQTMFQSLQMESGKEMDSLVNKIKAHIADYGKKKGYEYIFNTEDASTILYAKDGLDITDSIISELNTKYKGKSASEKIDQKEETKKED